MQKAAWIVSAFTPSAMIEQVASPVLLSTAFCQVTPPQTGSLDQGLRDTIVCHHRTCALRARLPCSPGHLQQPSQVRSGCLKMGTQDRQL